MAREVGMGIPLGEWSGAGATDRLRETIIELNEKTEGQTNSSFG
jgi:hypothetical protein